MTPAKRPETATTTPKVPTARPVPTRPPLPLPCSCRPPAHVATWGSLAGASTVLIAFQPARLIASYGCSAVLPRLTISGSMPSRFGKQSHVGPDSQRPSEEVGGERSKPRTPSTPETPRLTRCRGPRTSESEHFTHFSAATFMIWVYGCCFWRQCLCLGAKISLRDGRSPKKARCRRCRTCIDRSQAMARAIRLPPGLSITQNRLFAGGASTS